MSMKPSFCTCAANVRFPCTCEVPDDCQCGPDGEFDGESEENDEDE